MTKLSVLMFVWILWAGSLSTFGSNLQRHQHLSQGSNSTRRPILGHEQGSRVTNGEIKELATGNRGTISESFVLIARDSKTYDALRELSTSLPEQSAEFFETNVVVAAFLGQRRTSGYSVEITNGPDGNLRIVEHSPPDGAKVKMALSAPFKIVAVPADTDHPIVLALDETWKKRLRSYRVTNGQLSITGGFAGVNQKRLLEGTIGIMRNGTLATFIFELRSKGGPGAKQLNDAASCAMKESGQLSLPRLNSSTLTGAIESPFQVNGEFRDNERELTLNMQTTSSPNVSDNFAATAQLVAVATEPPSHKTE